MPRMLQSGDQMEPFTFHFMALEDILSSELSATLPKMASTYLPMLGPGLALERIRRGLQYVLINFL